VSPRPTNRRGARPRSTRPRPGARGGRRRCPTASARSLQRHAQALGARVDDGGGPEHGGKAERDGDRHTPPPSRESRTPARSRLVRLRRRLPPSPPRSSAEDPAHHSPARSGPSVEKIAGATTKEKNAIFPPRPEGQEWRKRTSPITAGNAGPRSRKRLAPREAVVDPVPEGHLRLAELPAEVDDLALSLRRKVDEAELHVLQVSAALFDLVHDRIQLLDEEPRGGRWRSSPRASAPTARCRSCARGRSSPREGGHTDFPELFRYFQNGGHAKDHRRRPNK